MHSTKTTWCTIFAFAVTAVLSTGATARGEEAKSRAVGRVFHAFNKTGGGIGCVAFSPDGQRALTGSKDGKIRLWDVESGSPLRTLVGHGDYVRAIAFLPDGRRAVSGSVDKTLRVWDLPLMERSNRTLREALEAEELPNRYEAEEAFRRIIHWYNTERLHSSLGYLRPVDYYRGQPAELHEARRKKLATARHRRREKNLGLRQPTLPLEANQPVANHRP